MKIKKIIKSLLLRRVDYSVTTIGFGVFVLISLFLLRKSLFESIVFNVCGFALVFGLNYIDYTILKKHYLNKNKFDLNICCGDINCGGVNADIIKRNVPNFVLVNDIYSLPFSNKQFDKTICSHTLEHVSCPSEFFNELQRISKEVVILVPPLWDFGSIFNISEHRYQFITLNSQHTNKLPCYFRLPFSGYFQRKVGQHVGNGVWLKVEGKGEGEGR